MSKTKNHKISKEQIDEVAEYLKGAGRKGDTELAHLTNGEIILPKSVIEKLDPKVLEAAFKEAGRDLGRYTVGASDDSLNPSTGLREYMDADGQGTSEAGATGHDGGGGNTGGGGDTSVSSGESDVGQASQGVGTGTGGVGVGGVGGGEEGGRDEGDRASAADAVGIGGFAPDPDGPNAGGRDEGARALGAEETAAPGMGPMGAPTVDQQGYGALAVAGGKLAGPVGSWVGKQVDKALNNPIATAFDIAVGIANPALGLINTGFALADKPTVGSTVTSTARDVAKAANELSGVSVSLAEALGEFAPVDPSNPNPNDPNRDGSGGGDAVTVGNNIATQVAAQEQATGQVATTLNSGANQGTIATVSTDRRRAFSRLTLGTTAGNKASLLW